LNQFHVGIDPSGVADVDQDVDERRPLPESPYTRRDLGFLDAAGELLAKQRAELARKKKKKRRPVEDDEADAEDAA
jgi:hypothetical protein